MKTQAFLFALLCSGTMLLSGCDTKTATTETGAAGDMATMDHSTMDHSTMDHSTMDHSTMDHSTMAGDSPLKASMDEMMAKMDGMKMKGNTDHDFAHMMLEHHKGAVAMADIQLRDGKDATMRQMAEKIKADQQQEIGELEAVATRLDNAPSNYQPQDPNDPFTAQMKMSMTTMMTNTPKTVANPDMNFNMLMTTHHQSAMDMAKAEVAHGKDSKLKAMAEKMIATQQKEIDAFKTWHAQNADKM